MEVDTVLWTDFAGVLTPPVEHTLGVFAGRVGVPARDLAGALRRVGARWGDADDPLMPVDVPLITEAQWLAEIRAELSPDLAARVPGDSIGEQWFDGRLPNEAWVEELLRVRERGVFVGLMSNMMPEWDVHWRRMVPVGELFDDVLLSFAIGCRKPQPEIYALAAQRSGAEPADCVLVDDTEVNCVAARDAGWTAIHFTGTVAAIAALDDVLAARGVAPATAGAAEGRPR